MGSTLENELSILPLKQDKEEEKEGKEFVLPCFLVKADRVRPFSFFVRGGNKEQSNEQKQT